MVVLAIALGLFVGAILGWVAKWWLYRDEVAALAQNLSAAQLELAKLAERQSSDSSEAVRLRHELTSAEQQFASVRDLLDAARDEVAKLEERAQRLAPLEAELKAARDGKNSAEAQHNQTRLGLEQSLVELRTTVAAERTKFDEKLALLNEARDQLSLQFKTLANEILEEKSKRFAEQNQASLKQILEPLGTRLREFQGKVEEVYVQEGKDRSALAEQVKQLLGLNQQLSQDAHRLTLALTGQAKARGNWGEIILERVLEASGLRKGQEYSVQESHLREDGSRVQPDVIVNLPGSKHLVVDSKVSLIAHSEYVSAADDTAKDIALRKLLASMRSHIKDLSGKNYQSLYGLGSLDCVLMFVPIEPAFLTAISADETLWQDAWQKNILLVSPSTLLFVLRTVAHLWNQEQQTKNAQEIARRGAELYDKFVGFVEELSKVGDKLEQAQSSYKNAIDRLAVGRGNVVRQAEMLKSLGIKPTKSLPPSVTDLSELSEEDEQAKSGLNN